MTTINLVANDDPRYSPQPSSVGQDGHPNPCAYMHPKDPTATAQLLALLESRYAMRVLWALRDGHAQTFRLLQDSVGGITPNTLNTRLKELRGAGLLTHEAAGYQLTALGAELLRRLAELSPFATRWAAQLARTPH